MGLEAVPDACEAIPAEAADGARYGRGFGDEQVGQIVATEPGQTYTVTLSHVAVEQCYGGMPSSAWDVLVDGAVVLTTPGDVGSTWAEASVDFVANSETTEVCFRKAGGAGGLDAVSVLAQ